MSSTTEGRDDGARDDELDLGGEDEESKILGESEGIIQDPLSPTADDSGDAAAEVEHDIPPINDPGQQGDGTGTGFDSDLARTEEKALPVDQEVNGPGSGDETASIPDDTPSLHGSLLSSQSSSAVGLRGSPGFSPSPSHRPFDLRFQSRLSSSYFGSPRPASPLAHIHHSRQSSFASLGSPGVPESEAETETPSGPWDAVRWTKLRKITGQAFSEVGKRNFGRPTCMAISTSIVLGTSKGIILVFDYQQNLKAIIGTGTKALECGAVTSLALSADHSTVAGGHASGDIFTWEISRSAKPFLHIPPIPSKQIDSRTSDGHVSGAPVIHVGFLGTRRTALVSADERGMAFSHLATRGMGAVGRTVKTTRILGRYPQTPTEAAVGKPRKPSSVLAFSPLPLGNVEHSTDGLGLVAMLTPYLLVIVSTTPIAQTQHKAPRPKEVAAHGALTGALAWFPAIKLKGKDSQISKTKLAYCWSNVLTVLDVTEQESDEPTERDKPPSLLFKARSRWKAEEAIVAVQWLSRSVLAVLTITQQLLILEDNTMQVTEAVDLINRHIYHVDLFSSQLRSLVEQYNEEDTTMHGVVADAFFMSFRSYKGRVFLLGHNDVSVGSVSNWADRLLALMEAGDFIGAIRLATSYYKGSSEKLTVGLPEEESLRHPIVLEKLLEMITASLKYAFGRNQEATGERVSNMQLEELAQVSISACVTTGEKDFLWDEVYDWYDENDAANLFLDALEPYIVDDSVRSLPPTAVKTLISHYSTNHTADQLEEIICLLDTTTMDIDQVTTLCKQYNLYDAYIYVWNRSLGDYVSPLQELLGLIPSHTGPIVNGDAVDGVKRQANAIKMFPYMSFVLTGHIYPTGEDMDDMESARAKSALYSFIFSGHLDGIERGSGAGEIGTFPTLSKILHFDTASFMSMLNEAFEDSYLNEQDSEDLSPGVRINRQYLVSIMLQVMESPAFTPLDTIYLDMFVARNLPKYPQYILLPGSTLHQVLVRLCNYPSEEMADDCQLSVEYLLSMYHPPDIHDLIPLFKRARFFRILKSTFRAEKQFPQLVLTYLEDPSDQQAIFTCLQDCLRPGSGLGKRQRRDVVDVIKAHAGHLAAINVALAAQVMQDLAPEVHETFLLTLEREPYQQFQYLAVLIDSRPPGAGDAAGQRRKLQNWMVERYVQLLCRYDPSRVADFVDDLREGDVRLDELLPSMEESGIVDATVILLARQGKVQDGMDRLIAHIVTLESGLMGLLRSVDESPDAASTEEAIADLVESLNKYVRVGIWLCQGQAKSVMKPSGPVVANGKRGASVLEQPLSFVESLWLDFIEAVVRIASNVFSQVRDGGVNAQSTHATSEVSVDSRELDQLTPVFRALVQQVFTALLSSTIKSGGAPTTPAAAAKTDISFLRILHAFLTRAATWSTSLFELRAVLASIFSAYTYEKSLLSLANGMLDRDLFVHVAELTRLRQRGWRPRGQVCEICRRPLWGPGIGAEYWEAWQKKQDEERRRRESRRSKETSVSETVARSKGKTVAVRESQDSTPDDDHRRSSVDDHQLQQNAEREERDASGTAMASTDPREKRVVEPIVVFSCRHLYHRRCLIDADSQQQQLQPQSSGESSTAGSCPACT